MMGKATSTTANDAVDMILCSRGADGRRVPLDVAVGIIKAQIRWAPTSTDRDALLDELLLITTGEMARFDEIFERYIEPGAVWFAGVFALLCAIPILMAQIQ